MEKRFTAKTEDNSISDAPDRKAGLVLLIISGALILAIGFAVAAAVKIKNNAKASESTGETTSQTATEPSQSAVPVEYFGGTYPDGTVPTDIMSLSWGAPSSEIKVKYPDVLSEDPSSLKNEADTVNLTYSRKARVGGFDFSHVVLSVDRREGLYAFSYLLDKDRYAEVKEALGEEFGKPVFRSGDSSYWNLEGDVLMYLTLRTVEADKQEHTFLQYIYVKEKKSSSVPPKTPVLTLGMTVEEVRKRKMNAEKFETALDGTETYIVNREYDISSDTNLGKFAPADTYASAVFLYFDPKVDLTSYSFVVKGDHLYEVREKIANEYGNPSIIRDFSSQWNLNDGKAYITVSYGRMSGSGRGFGTEIRYTCTTEKYNALEKVKAVGRATRKGMKYKAVKSEIGKYRPAENINKKGNGTMTLINNDGADIIVFGVRVRSVEIEFRKNVVTDVYYIFDGSSYESIKMNIETNYGPGEAKLRFKDHIKRYLWQPKTTENNKFTKIMLDYVQLKTNPKCRVHYYG